jgi:hypothetical protein
LKEATFYIPEDIREYLADTSLESVTFQYTDPVHALINMLHFNPLAADPDNLCFVYEESACYDDFCNGDRVRRIQVQMRVHYYSCVAGGVGGWECGWGVVVCSVRFSPINEQF